MSCPNCSNSLKMVHCSLQNVLHCSTCGASFFQENAINRITTHDARELGKDRTGDIVMGTPRICPTDNLFLGIIDHDEAVPQNAILYKCPKCNGIFALHDDLLKFKKAQDVKIQFFKVWNAPLPSLKAVLVMSFVAILSLTLFSNLHTASLPSTRAEDIVQNVNFSRTDTTIIVNFQTASPYITRIIIVDKTLHTQTIKDISHTPSILHFTSFKDISIQHNLFYQLELTDKNGKKIITSSTQLIFK